MTEVTVEWLDSYIQKLTTVSGIYKQTATTYQTIARNYSERSYAMETLAKTFSRAKKNLPMSVEDFKEHYAGPLQETAALVKATKSKT